VRSDLRDSRRPTRQEHTRVIGIITKGGIVETTKRFVAVAMLLGCSLPFVAGVAIAQRGTSWVASTQGVDK
jgi:hypothetical protein